MEGLNHIRESFGLTMILVAHFRKRNGRNPIEISDIEGSSVICNYTDSIVAIGSSVEGTEIKYLKQLKTRSAQKRCRRLLLCVWRMFPGFILILYGLMMNSTTLSTVRKVAARLLTSWERIL